MIKDNKRQKLRLLTEWMDYFIMEHKEEIKRSLHEEGIVFIQEKQEDENVEVVFGLMILSNQEIDVTLRLTKYTGDEAGKSFWFDIRKRKGAGIVLFNEDTEVKRLMRYPLQNFLQFATHKAFEHLLSWVQEAEAIRKVTQAHEAEAEGIIQESLLNYYLEKRDFEALRHLFPVNETK